MSVQITSAQTVLEAQYGQYAVVSVSAPAAEYAQVLALGQSIAVEHGIAPALVQVTPLTTITTLTAVAPALVSGTHGRPDQGIKVGVVPAQQEQQAQQAQQAPSIRYLITVSKSVGKR